MLLFIYTRKGCCICEALKNNLMNIDLNSFQPVIKIQEIDIDRFDLYKNQFKKYDHQVPVLALQDINTERIYELPRISPRLKDFQLKFFLQKYINNFLDNKLI